VQATDADATLVAAVVDRANLQRNRALGVHLGGGNLRKDGVEQRHHVHVAVVGIEARVTVHGRCVHHGEIKLLVRRAELDHEVEHLVNRTLGIGVRAVDLINHHHDAQAALKRVRQDEARLRLGALVRIDDQQRAVGHVQHALNLAAEVGMAGRVDDVDLHAFIRNRDVLRQNGDAALALLIVRVEHTLFNVLIFAKHVRRPQQTVHERGLAVVNVSDDRDVAEILLLHAFLSCSL